jgi:MFS family permease
VSGSRASSVHVTERSFKGSLRRTSSPRLGSCCSSVNSSHSRTWRALWSVRKLIPVHSTTKWVYIFLIFIFELGSLICGVAPTMEVLILGRAIAGVGGGGIFVSSTLLSVVFAVPAAHAPGHQSSPSWHKSPDSSRWASLIIPSWNGVLTPLQRPVLFGMFGGVFAVSSVVGPLLGGAFTDKVRSHHSALRLAS